MNLFVWKIKFESIGNKISIGNKSLLSL